MADGGDGVFKQVIDVVKEQTVEGVKDVVHQASAVVNETVPGQFGADIEQIKKREAEKTNNQLTLARQLHNQILSQSQVPKAPSPEYNTTKAEEQKRMQEISSPMTSSSKAPMSHIKDLQAKSELGRGKKG